MLEVNRIYNMDCLDGMKNLPSNSINLILTDPPYNTTQAEWEFKLDVKEFFNEMKRVLKEDGVIVMTSSEPLTSEIRFLNKGFFKYSAVWKKEQASNIFNLKSPLGRIFEDISIFYNSPATYNPQLEYSLKKTKSIGGNKTELFGDKYSGDNKIRNFTYPLNILKFNRDKTGLHPTQKPVRLFEYLIKTYSNEGDLVCDFFMGSGTTAVASINTSRKYIGWEKDKEFWETCLNRISKTKIDLIEKAKQKDIFSFETTQSHGKVTK